MEERIYCADADSRPVPCDRQSLDNVLGSAGDPAGEDVSTILRLQTYKGWLYVAVTAALVWWQIRKYVLHICRVERELRRSNVALTSILAAAPIAICVTDTDGRLLSINQAAYRLFGWSEAEVLGMQVGDCCRFLDADLQALAAKACAGETFSGIETRVKTKDEKNVDISLSIAPLCEDGKEVTGVVIVAADVTERKEQERKIRQLELIDPLTGIFNRQALERHLRRVVENIHATDEAVLLILAVDNFKLVNESVGHDLGDVVLAELTSLLTHHLPSDAVFGRWSGDEIAVILEGIALPQAEQLAEEVRQAIEETRFVDGISVTASIGLVAIEAGISLKELLSLADEALLHAQGRGRNQVVVCRQAGEHGRILTMANWLSTWIREGSLKERIMLYYQPIVNLRTGETEYYEALLRVKGREDELILPKDFIPVAERFGLMPEVDYCVVEKAVNLLHRNPGIKVFVNLSGSSMVDLNLLAKIEGLLQKYNLRPGQLTIEVTENAAITDMEKMYQWMHRLRDLGCRFALDDFGVGFSTFSNLRAIPVDWVKIDGSFVHNIDSDLVSRKLVAAISSVAHSLDKKIIAEWIGSAAAVRCIAELGVEYGQGYYLGKPSPTLTAWIGREEFLAKTEAAATQEK